MKKITIILFLLVLFMASYGTDWVNISSDKPSPVKIELISSGPETSIIHFVIDGFLQKEVVTSKGNALVIGLEEASPIMEKGAPDMPKVTASVMIPDLAKMQLEVISSSYTDYVDILVAPSKGNLYRDIDPDNIPYEFGIQYQQDAFYPDKMGEMRDPYIIRDFRGQTIIVYPFRYNPESKTLRVYHDLTIKVSKKSDRGINQLIRKELLSKIDPEFSHIYETHFLNYSTVSRYDPVEEYGNFLIIAFNDFMSAMQPFIAWKKQTGYPVEMVDVASIGNAAAIKTFLQNYYDTKGLTFVLLVGDAPQVPTSSTNAGDSDNHYSYVAGNDHYPDFFIGRFSAESVGQVETQVDRTVTYEQNPETSIDWFTIGTGIASSQGPGDDGEYDYEHIRNINTDLLGFTYTYCHELFDGSQGGNDAPGNPTPAMVAEAVNDGTSIINYTGHGSTNSWSSSGFSSSDVNNLMNDNMLPFIWSVACSNGNFKNGTCFAENWLRATNNGTPTGAIAFLGSTIGQSWNPPMCGQDEMVDILVESYADNIRRTYGAMSMEGCMQMNDEYGGDGEDMTDTWTCFGDPSVMVRTAVPEIMAVTHDPVLFIGASQLVIVTNAEGGRATLTLEGTMLATGVIQGGAVTLSFGGLTAIGTATLTITAFNFMPYIANIDIIPADGPYVILEDFEINDESGNGNGHADYDELILLSVEMENVGVEDAANVMVNLSANDPYVMVTDNFEDYGLIPAGQSVTIEDAFGFLVADNIPDQYQVTFTLSSSDGDNTWESLFLITLNAPVLSIDELTIDDTETGNGNGQLDPGERVEIIIHYNNSGHTPAINATSFLEAQCGSVEIIDPVAELGSIGLFGGADASFFALVDEDAPEGILAPLYNQLTVGGYELEKTYQEKISAICEDFETGDFSAFNWQFGGDQPWNIINDFPYEGNYSIISGNIDDGQSSEISLAYEVMVADSIAFIRKVSSDPDDKLKFFINNQLIEEWSGMTSGWKRECFAVNAGTKTFKWVYQKNGDQTMGADCGWLDYIIFPPPVVLTAWAGSDQKICTGDNALLNGEATDYTQLEWTTAGTGTFYNNTMLNTTYTPSDDDIANGSVSLTLTASDDEGGEVNDEILLTFTTVPEAPPAPQGPDFVNVTFTASTVYLTDGIEDIRDYNWYLEPQEAGEIINHGLTGIVIWDQAYLGIATVKVAAVNDCGEGALSDGFEVTVDNITGLPDIPAVTWSVSVMPNPAHRLFNIQLDGTVNGPLNLKVIGITGILIYEQQNIDLPDNGRISIDISQWPTSVYVLVIESKNRVATHKIIKF